MTAAVMWVSLILVFVCLEMFTASSTTLFSSGEMDSKEVVPQHFTLRGPSATIESTISYYSGVSFSDTVCTDVTNVNVGYATNLCITVNKTGSYSYQSFQYIYDTFDLHQTFYTTRDCTGPGTDLSQIYTGTSFNTCSSSKSEVTVTSDPVVPEKTGRYTA